MLTKPSSRVPTSEGFIGLLINGFVSKRLAASLHRYRVC